MNNANPKVIPCEIEPIGEVSLPFDSEWTLLIKPKTKVKNAQSDINGNSFLNEKGKGKNTRKPDEERKTLNKEINRYDNENERAKFLELLKFFEKDELRAFCIITYSFTELEDQVKEKTKKDAINEIVWHAYRKNLFPELHEWTKEKNPNRYYEFFPDKEN